ncbi:MAG TPA: M28 family peptidase [Candidatus Eremiobacteraceae bacterium]|nr:M28 family peptidase [Candidatus Eremiobacteraceae bacterium]
MQAAPCGQRVNDTLPKIDACMTQASLWQELSQFQRISDANKGPDGHGNRDTGTPGYEASVDYVARLMQRAGYTVTLQPFSYDAATMSGTPQFETAHSVYVLHRDWFIARRSGSGAVTAMAEPPSRSGDGCAVSDFAGFTRGRIALLGRGPCAVDRQVANAQAAGAGAVILYTAEGGPHEIRLNSPVGIPVIGFASGAVGADLLRQYRSRAPATVHIDIQMRHRRSVDYNVVADSPFGDPNHVVVIEGHLDSIYGAGMLDNASGSVSILGTALAMAKTHTHNQLRYIWFGGEEIGLFGSSYYTTHLSPTELHKIVFDVDADVTATPNFDMEIADPAYASDSGQFPPNVIPGSKVGNDAFADFFTKIGTVSLPAPFGNDGTDSNSFALVGVPDTGILTRQDCCKESSEVQLWGGFLGNYEGTVPGNDGGCVDMPDKWCDNLSNNDPFILGVASKAVAHVTFQLANDAALRR